MMPTSHESEDAPTAGQPQWAGPRCPLSCIPTAALAARRTTQQQLHSRIAAALAGGTVGTDRLLPVRRVRLRRCASSACRMVYERCGLRVRFAWFFVIVTAWVREAIDHARLR